MSGSGPSLQGAAPPAGLTLPPTGEPGVNMTGEFPAVPVGSLNFTRRDGEGGYKYIPSTEQQRDRNQTSTEIVDNIYYQDTDGDGIKTSTLPDEVVKARDAAREKGPEALAAFDGQILQRARNDQALAKEMGLPNGRHLFHMFNGLQDGALTHTASDTQGNPKDLPRQGGGVNEITLSNTNRIDHAYYTDSGDTTLPAQVAERREAARAAGPEALAEFDDFLMQAIQNDTRVELADLPGGFKPAELDPGRKEEFEPKLP